MFYIRIRKVLSMGVYSQIPDNELLEKQRYKLFLVFSISLFLVCLAESFHAMSFHTGEEILGPGLQFFSLVSVINFIVLQWHKKLRIAYATAILTSFACV